MKEEFYTVNNVILAIKLKGFITEEQFNKIFEWLKEVYADDKY